MGGHCRAAVALGHGERVLQPSLPRRHSVHIPWGLSRGALPLEHRPCLLVPARLLATAPGGSARGDWKTIPNALTALRLVAVPGLVASWYAGAPGVSAALFGAAAV